MPFFSVIVPEHNSEKFMRKGLDSIKEQTFTDYELIIVCDACTDNTVNIAKEYTDKVFEIDKKRCGAARNLGLDNAKGQWILFMDDDDWFLHNYVFEMLYNKIKTIDTEVLAFSFIMNHRGYTKCGMKWPAIWNKAWKRSAIEKKHYRFPMDPIADDYGFAKSIHPHVTSTCWDMPLYYYNYLREGSLSDREKNGEDFSLI